MGPSLSLDGDPSQDTQSVSEQLPRHRSHHHHSQQHDAGSAQGDDGSEMGDLRRAGQGFEASQLEGRLEALEVAFKNVVTRDELPAGVRALRAGAVLRWRREQCARRAQSIAQLSNLERLEQRLAEHEDKVGEMRPVEAAAAAPPQHAAARGGSSLSPRIWLKEVRGRSQASALTRGAGRAAEQRRKRVAAKHRAARWRRC